MPIDAAVALTTLADVKAFLKVTGAADDAVIGDIVNGASQLIVRYTGRNWLQATYTEYYDSDGGNRLVLNNFPVISITSINDDPNRIWAASTAVDPAFIILDSNAGIVRVWNGKPSFFVGQGNIKVMYVAGFTPGPTGTLPYDVQVALKLITLQVYKVRYASQRVGVKSETIGDRTLTFDYDVIPKEAKEILDHHREVGMMMRQGQS